MKMFSFLLPLTALLAFTSCSLLSSQSSDKAITSFAFVNPPVSGVIDEAAKTITVVVPEGTVTNSLAAVFTTTGTSVSVGTEVQVSGLSVNSFRSPVQYTVTAEDNSVALYTVTVVEALKQITTFSFPAINATGSVNHTNKTINVAVPSTTDLTALVATFTNTGSGVAVAGVPQVSGVTPNNFALPVVYTVTGIDGTMGNYTVSIVKSATATWSTFDWTDAVVEPDGWLNREEMNTFCTIADGVLTFNSDVAANQAHYRLAFPSEWEDGSKMTLVLKARGDGEEKSLAWMVDFQNRYRGLVEIRNGQVVLKGVGSVDVAASVMHTYMITYEILADAVLVNVFIDGAPTAALSGKSTTPASGIHIRLGDMSGSNSYKGSLDWIMWTSDGAYFPGGVELPAGFSLSQ